MIYHELFGQHLRLGNFAFKIAWSVAKWNQYKIQTYYPDYYLWKYLKVPPVITTGQPNTRNVVRPLGWEYSEFRDNLLNSQIAINQSNNKDSIISLDYFFQSEKWFKGYEKEVIEFFSFKDEYIDLIKDKYSYILNRPEPTIAIGVRLGDFIGHNDFYQIPYTWYIEILENYFPHWKERPVIIFSDHIEKAKEIFKDYPFFYPEPNNTHTHADNFKHYHNDAAEQFILGTLMDDWIIGNSTFSWWQAYIAQFNSPLNKVFHSGEVFSDKGKLKNIDTFNYYPHYWYKHGIETK